MQFKLNIIIYYIYSRVQSTLQIVLWHLTLLYNTHHFSYTRLYTDILAYTLLYITVLEQETIELSSWHRIQAQIVVLWGNLTSYLLLLYWVVTQVYWVVTQVSSTLDTSVINNSKIEFMGQIMNAVNEGYSHPETHDISSYLKTNRSSKTNYNIWLNGHYY